MRTGGVTVGRGASQFTAAGPRLTWTFPGGAAMTCESIEEPENVPPPSARASISYRPSGNRRKNASGSSSSKDGSALSNDSWVRPFALSFPRPETSNNRPSLGP